VRPGSVRSWVAPAREEIKKCLISLHRARAEAEGEDVMREMITGRYVLGADNKAHDLFTEKDVEFHPFYYKDEVG
jgi:hypothetical protein